LSALIHTTIQKLGGPLWIRATVIVGLCGISLLFVPQFNLLNYFFSFAIALPLSLVVCVYAARLTTVDSRDNTHTHVRHVILGIATIALVPLLPVAIAAIWVQNCDPLAGLSFYVMGPLIGAVFAGAVGISSGTLFGHKWGWRVAVIGWFLSIVWNMAHIYNHPAIFAYNPFVGFFSGAIYDEVVRIAGPYGWYRANTAIQVFLLLALSRVWRWHRRSATAWGFVLLLGLAATTSFLFRATLGHEIDRDDVVETLGGRYETEHFVLHYDRDGVLANHIQNIGDDHEFRHWQLREMLGVEPSEKVHSFLYDTPAQKRQLMGADRTYIAKPWNNEMHLNAIQPGAAVLKHELAHVFGGAIHTGWLRVPNRFGLIPNMGLVEGFAEACTWTRGPLTLHQWSAALHSLKLAPPMTRLLGATGFLSSHSGQVYTLAGSFLRYLLDTQGVAKFRELYATGDLEKTYGSTTQQLVDDWTAFLNNRDRVPLSEANLEQARFRFDAPSLFQRVCGLEVARWSNEANQAFHERNYCRAVTLRQKILSFTPESPGQHFQLSHAHIAMDQWGEASKALAWIDTSDASRVLKTHARIRRADVDWMQGRLETAQHGYQAAQKEPLAAAVQRALIIKLEALRWTDKKQALVARDTLTDPRLRNDSAIERLQGIPAGERHAILWYLLGRRLAVRGDYDLAVQSLGAALNGGLKSDILQLEATTLQGQLLIIAGKHTAGRANIAAARQQATEPGTKAVLDDWLERARWMERKLTQQTQSR